MNGITTNGITHNGNHIAINFTTSDGGLTPALLTATTNSPMQIGGHQNLQQQHHQQSSSGNVTFTNGSNTMSSIATGQGLQIISTSNSSVVATATSTSVHNGGASISTKVFGGIKNGIRTTMVSSSDGNLNNSNITNSGGSQHNLISTTSNNNHRDGAKLEILTPKMTATNSLSSEPPAKVIKLINGSIALASVVDKDSKLLSSNSLTLSQVCPLFSNLSKLGGTVI